ncbi:hypothetical protein Tco_0632261, partial [Tanacetum coccineum]
RAHNSAWFKEKMLLEHVPEAGFALNDEQLAFLAYSGEKVVLGTDAYTLTNNALGCKRIR